MTAKLSILLPTKNRLDLLKLAVETVRRQSHTDWEIVISDNASTEDVRGYADSLNDARIRYVRADSSLPVTENWNLALEHSTGDYVVMLGDDDGLLKGYLANISMLIERYQEPELILTDAILYAYPKVFPGHESGFLQIAYGVFFDGRSAPYFLGRDMANRAVRAALSLRVAFQFNMQYSVISRRLIERLKQYGNYFQSPYPDFYASNANLLLADRILVVPRPMVCIGVSPKSYGFYYFNRKQEEGANFLDNMAQTEIWMQLRPYLLPGNDLFSCWLVAVETVSRNFLTYPSTSEKLNVAYHRYRRAQLWFVASHGKPREILSICSKATGLEWLTFPVLAAALVATRLLPNTRITRWIRRQLDRALSPYPDRDTRVREVSARDMLEVFESVAPEYY